MKKTKEPVVLTALEGTRRGLESMKRQRGKPAEAFFTLEEPMSGKKHEPRLSITHK